MPAVTRNQMKMMRGNKLSKKIVNPVKVKEVEQVEERKSTINLEVENLKKFKAYVMRMLSESNKLNKSATRDRNMSSKLMETKISDKFMAANRCAYYDNLRVITELYYNINEWFDILMVKDGIVCGEQWQKFIDTIYKKSICLEHEIKR